MTAHVLRLPSHCWLLLSLILAGCATSRSPSPSPSPTARPPSSRIETQPAPRWRAVPARADGAAVPGGRRHIVKRGETGIAIAKAYAVPWGRIAAANKIARDAVLQIGQPLFVPTGEGTATARSGRKPPRGRQSRQFSVAGDDLITGTTAAGQAPAPPAPQSGASSIPAMGWPIDGRVILSGFGPKPGGRVNDGINIKAQQGATVRAAADGQVIYVGDAISGFGLMLLVRHGAPGADAVVTTYGHLEDALVQRGQTVTRGQPIARAGRSGAASEPQLLFQIRQGRRAIDPRAHLP